MKPIIILSLISIAIILMLFKKSIEKYANPLRNNKLCIIVTTYNPGESYIDKCLKSIEIQTYKNYSVCIVDDASNKNVAECHAIIRSYCERNGWEFIVRSENIGPLGARIDAINKLCDASGSGDEIIVSVDGDDELNDRYVFNKLNTVYQDDTMITFGNYINVTKDNVLSKPRVNCRRHNFKKIIRNNGYRRYAWIFTHLKTFKYKLYRGINHTDLKRNGRYLKSATDIALMIPMLEMSGGKFKCVQNVMYKYNRTHTESHNVDTEKLRMQTDNARYIKRLPPYENRVM